MYTWTPAGLAPNDDNSGMDPRGGLSRPGLPLICKKSYKLTVKFWNLKNIFEIDREFQCEAPGCSLFPQILDLFLKFRMLI
jgi:hypothetical protein